MIKQKVLMLRSADVLGIIGGSILLLLQMWNITLMASLSVLIFPCHRPA